LIGLVKVLPDGFPVHQKFQLVKSPILRLADITNEQVSTRNTRSIVLLESEVEKNDLKSGDILITRVNGSIDSIGSFTLINHDNLY
jgi:hypothetical protein